MDEHEHGKVEKNAALAIEDIAGKVDQHRMGLVLNKDGTATIRVWAPHARRVVLDLARLPNQPIELGRDLAKEHVFTAALESGFVSGGDRYRLVLHTFAEPPDQLLRRDVYARQTDFDSEWCFAHDPYTFEWKNASWQRPAFDTYTIYELHVGSFTPEGTFLSAADKLDHIAQLGFTAVQLMPILEHSDLWGYNPRQFLALHGAYGTPDEFKELVDRAHGIGLAVIVDVVLHHGAVDGNALWNYDGWAEHNNGGIFHENAPDTEWGRSLAHWKAEVMDMLFASCSMYLAEYRVDGLRFDSANDLPLEACQKLTYKCREKFPGVFLTAEVTPENPHAVHHLGFDALWIHSGYFDIIHQHRALGRGHHGGGDWADGWDFGKLRTVFTLHYGFETPTQCIKYLTGSHDQIGCKNGGAVYEDYQMIGGQHRYATDQFGSGRQDPHARSAVKAWFTVNVCAGGIPMMFMGTEWAQPGWWNVDEHRRLDWNYAQDEIGKAMQRFIGDSVALRKRFKALRLGAVNVLHEDRQNGVIAVDRVMDGEERIIIVLNAGRDWFQSEEYGVYIGGDDYEVEEFFTTQKPEYLGWSGQHSNENRKIPVVNGRIFINIPAQATMLFKPCF